MGCSPWSREESDTTEQLHFHFSLSCIGEGNGNPLQCFCLENPRDGGAWWAAVYGVAQSRTRLKGLSSSSIPYHFLPQNIPLLPKVKVLPRVCQALEGLLPLHPLPPWCYLLLFSLLHSPLVMLASLLFQADSTLKPCHWLCFLPDKLLPRYSCGLITFKSLLTCNHQIKNHNPYPTFLVFLLICLIFFIYSTYTPF